jgi:hypothetical protein
LTAETGGFGGTVTLNVDGTDIVTRPVLSLTGQVSLTDTNIGGVTTHTVMITYNGDAGNPSVLSSVGYAAYPAGTFGWLPGSSIMFTYTRTSTGVVLGTAHSANTSVVLGTAPEGHTSATSVQGNAASPKSTTAPLVASHVDGYFATTTTGSTTRTLAGALTKVHSNDEWLGGAF